LPAGVAAAVPRVRVELPPAVIVAGLKVAEAAAGSPEALRLTLCAAPLVTAVEMVLVPLAPWDSDRLAGLAEIEKSGGGGALTVSPRVVEWVALVPVPVTVTE